MTDGGAAIVTNMAVVRSTLRYFVLFLLLCTMVYLSFEDVFSYLEAVPSSQCVGKVQRVLKSVTRVVLFALCLKTFFF
jgi:hypothetical protein